MIMKKYIFIFIMALGFWCCQKEDDITPQLELENLYTVANSDSDTIQQRLHEIYEKYQVTVTFNDTIGKVFVKTDIHGDSVFTYETVDPGYSFTTFNSLDYNYVFMTDPEQQSRMLDVVESYLEQCNDKLYPQVVLLVDSYSTTDQRGTVTEYSIGDYNVTYRALLLSSTTDEAMLETLPDEIMKTFIISRISDYSSDLLAFNQISRDFIGMSWSTLGVSTLREPVTYMGYNDWWEYVEITVTEFYEYPLYSSCSCLQDDWWGFYELTPEAVEDFRNAVRQLIGPFGFVMESAKSPVGAPPTDTEDDLQVFVTEMLRFSQEEFASIWGEYSLVMQKYEILYDLLTNEFGVTL